MFWYGYGALTEVSVECKTSFSCMLIVLKVKDVLIEYGPESVFKLWEVVGLDWHGCGCGHGWKCERAMRKLGFR